MLTHTLNSPDSSFDSLLSEARGGDEASMGKLLQQYRNYLSVLAATQFRHRLKSRVDPSDVVQDALLRACKHFGQFRGTTNPELVAWLRKILVNSLAQFVEQHVLAERRDVRREMSIQQIGADLEQSTAQLASLLPASGVSPSRAVQREEESILLADRLAQLPDDYREVLVLRNLQELPFEEVARRMQRTAGATRMLWLRAMEKLRCVYHAEDPHDS